MPNYFYAKPIHIEFLRFTSWCLLISVRDDYEIFRSLSLVTKKFNSNYVKKNNTQNLLSGKPAVEMTPFFSCLSLLLSPSLLNLSIHLFSSFLFFSSFPYPPSFIFLSSFSPSHPFSFLNGNIYVEQLAMSDIHRDERSIIS